LSDQPFEQTSLLPPTRAEKAASDRRRRSQDPCWEALIRATGAHPTAERVLLNVGLKAIRAACLDEGIPFENIPSEIERRAEAYRKVFPSCAITPMALAKHWCRVLGEATRFAAGVTVEEQTLARLRHNAHGEVAL